MQFSLLLNNKDNDKENNLKIIKKGNLIFQLNSSDPKTVSIINMHFPYENIFIPR